MYAVRMKSYMQIIRDKHKDTKCHVSLAQVFVKASVPTSTYYRTLAGSELRHETAAKVYRMLELLDGAHPKPSDKRKLKDDTG